MRKKPYNLPVPIVRPADTEFTIEEIKTLIKEHQTMMQRYEYLENLYKGFHDVYRLPEKESWKPDNRLAVNFPRYITDTFLGYAYGIPIKKTHPEDDVDEAIKEFDRINDFTDHEYEIAKKCCMYGHAFEYFYQNEDAQTKTTLCTPKELFIVYDDTVRQRAICAIRYGYRGTKRELFGELMFADEIREFTDEKITEIRDNPYGMINCVEYMLNSERIGLYEQVSGLVEAYNRAIGEKANDVDSFAEAYLAVLGAELDDEGIYKIRDNRIINLYGTDDAKDILVQFLGKPTADGTQENLLNRLEVLIYQISMVANISDESFGNASGVSLAYKLLAMSNLALTVDRKFEKSIRKRYKIFCSLPTNVSDPEAYNDIEITMSRNVPKNLLEEAQIATMLEGVVSKETQLNALSMVKDAAAEIEKMKEEEQSTLDPVMDRTFGGDNNEPVLEK